MFVFTRDRWRDIFERFRFFIPRELRVSDVEREVGDLFDKFYLRLLV